jgi:hypothetical protein
MFLVDRYGGVDDFWDDCLLVNDRLDAGDVSEAWIRMDHSRLMNMMVHVFS